MQKRPALAFWFRQVDAIVAEFGRAFGELAAPLVLALGTLDDVLPVLSEQDRKCGAKGLKIKRLLRSAIRAVRSATRPESESTAQSIASIYGGDYDGQIWTDCVKDWSEKGRLLRERAGR